MSKIIVSWLAFNKDFIKMGGEIEVDPKGPTLLIHEELFPKNSYDSHYILQCRPNPGSELEEKIRRMESHLSEKYPKNNYKLELLSIKEEDLSDYKIITSQLRSFLIKVDVNDEIEVITGTGSAIMHMAWVALFYSMDLKFKLYLMHHNSNLYPSPIPVPLTKSKVLEHKLKEFHLKESLPQNIIMDDSLENTYKNAEAFANADELNILILGETGTGKDILAEHVFKNSPRSDKPYLKINCASLDDTLLYSELFGHVKGAYTDAKSAREGLFKKCDGGTLFMDEIGDISHRMQVSLLRVIQNKEIKPLGQDTVIENVNVRIIAATNADLLDKCEKNEFRWDLYYRLCDCELILEPFRYKNLTVRKSIIDKFLKEAEENWGYKFEFTEDAKLIFYKYDFPGNFREIRNTINNLFAYKQNIIKKTDLPKRIFRNNRFISDNLKEKGMQHIERVYSDSHYNIAETARRLGYSNPHQLKLKMERLGIEIR